MVLLGRSGQVLGSLADIDVDTPWWQEVGDVVTAVARRDKIDVTVLRLLDSEQAEPHGGHVTYLAELQGDNPPDLPLAPWAGKLDEDPRRLGYARPGGPASDLAWAYEILDTRGLSQSGPARQVRSWNLSSIWQLKAGGRDFWLKVIPPFFQHEGAIIKALENESVPILIASAGPRLLFEAIPGDDRYDAGPEEIKQMIGLLVGMQIRWCRRDTELLNLGLPDWRGNELVRQIRDVVERRAPELGVVHTKRLWQFIAGLEDRFAALAECGIANSFVHGDFHPGNLRGTPDNLTLLDWGDCGVGHPLLDQLALLDRVPAAAVNEIREHWNQCWQAALPDADVEQAVELVTPIAAARMATIYQKFLDHIEPSERRYHQRDPTVWLANTADML